MQLNSSSRGRGNGRGTSKPPSAPKTAPSNSPPPDTLIAPNTRATASHILFWGGILSNWHLESPTFSGTRCLELMLPRLDSLKIAHPSPNALSTTILAAHQFICGEQWMMAVKAWLFERSSVLSEMVVDLEQGDSSESIIGRERFEALRHAVMQSEPPGEFAQGTKERQLYDNTLYAMLQAETPKEQKALGRLVDWFDGDVWDKASVPIVVASCIARAEADTELRRVYQAGVSRKFVEGSPFDKIWGVGIKWNNTAIDNERNWKGENRLGKCHDEAAAYIREQDT